MSKGKGERWGRPAVTRHSELVTTVNMPGAASTVVPGR